MLEFLDIDVEIRKSPGDFSQISHLIIPGVGAFDTGMKQLEETGWKSAIESSLPNMKLLGICLGMQLLTKGSEEGSLPGLGIVDAYCRKFDSNTATVPHMGWNSVEILQKNSLLEKSTTEKRYYFTHSYYVIAEDPGITIMETSYGTNFVSGFQYKNICGLQFHPEKSHKFGMEILRNFAGW